MASKNIDSETIITIYLDEICEYFKGMTRPLREGQSIVDAGWVFQLGIASQAAKIKVLGYVIQTSQMTKYPHEVEMNNLLLEVSQWVCRCTCKAGIGEKCKHIAACLIFIHRNEKLYPLSCTEVKQKWGKAGREIVSEFSAVKICDMCHVQNKKKTNPEEIIMGEMKQILLEKLLEGSPQCELTRMKQCYRSKNNSILPSQKNPNKCEGFFKMLFSENEYLKKFVPIMLKYVDENELIRCKFEAKVRKNVHEAIEICENTTSQTSAQWLIQRKIRITASISYNLFTYCKNKFPDWEKKIASIYFSNFKGNKYTKYGQYAERLAKIQYEKLYLLFQCGLVISSTLPYLACSPDGISYNGCEWKLVEIKCPVLGQEISAYDLLPKLKYLKPSNNYYVLNEKHNYYGQVQLGLAICNMKNCDFVIYSLYSKENVIINVPRDEAFINEYVTKLTHIYFKHIIKIIN